MPNLNPIQKNNIHITGNLQADQTIIFSHGFGTDQNAWQKLLGAFEQDYRIVLYDLVGGGKSEQQAFSANKYSSLQAYANDLTDICEYLQLKDTLLIAHSVSGMIGLLTAIQSPQYFSKLVFIGASPRYINTEDYTGGFTQEALNQLYETIEKNYFAWVGGFAPLAMANNHKPELAEGFAATLSAIRPDIALSVVRTIFQSDYRDRLSALLKPTLLIHCDNDIAVPLAVGDYLNNHIPNSVLKVIEAEGHFPHMSAPENVINAIKTFIYSGEKA